MASDPGPVPPAPQAFGVWCVLDPRNAPREEYACGWLLDPARDMPMAWEGRAGADALARDMTAQGTGRVTYKVEPMPENIARIATPAPARFGPVLWRRVGLPWVYRAKPRATAGRTAP